jgi:hypothetical protein
MRKRRKYRYYGYLPEEDFEAFCRVITNGSRLTVQTAGDVILRYLAKDKKELLKQAEMIEDLLERYG